jgi:hypothetical protein
MITKQTIFHLCMTTLIRTKPFYYNILTHEIDVREKQAITWSTRCEIPSSHDPDKQIRLEDPNGEVRSLTNHRFN